MRHAHSGKIPFDCPFFSTAGHTLTGQAVMVGCSKYLGSLTVCPLARRKKGHRDFATFATAPEGSVCPVGTCPKGKTTRRWGVKRALGTASARGDD